MSVSLMFECTSLKLALYEIQLYCVTAGNVRLQDSSYGSPESGWVYYRQSWLQNQRTPRGLVR